MNRRSFLAGSVAAAAASGLRFGRKGLQLKGEAQAAGEDLVPYPVVVVMLKGGLDAAMHLSATPNGAMVGSQKVVNRMNGDVGIKTEPKSGVRYFTGTVAAPGKADFVPHLPDVAYLRAFRGSDAHFSISKVWFGEFSEGVKPPVAPRTPWAHYVAAKANAKRFALKPVAALYHNISTFGIYDLAAWGTGSPDPSITTERVLSYDAFFKSLQVSNELPSFKRQSPAYALAGALDGARNFGGHPDLRGKFDAANVGASNVLKNLSNGGPLWPAPSLFSDLGVTSAHLAIDPTAPSYTNPFFALAYQSLVNNLSHVIGMRSFGKPGPGKAEWDSHKRNYDFQIAAGVELWSSLGKFIKLLKATPSPLVAGKTLFDTTNIWIQSEQRRAPETDPPNPNSDSTGTRHFSPGGVATFLGGRFKRGISIGPPLEDWYARPMNLDTGAVVASGGTVPNMDNLIATVIKAAGHDPAGHTNAQPINALLDMSL